MIISGFATSTQLVADFYGRETNSLSPSDLKVLQRCRHDIGPTQDIVRKVVPVFQRAQQLIQYAGCDGRRLASQ